MKLVTREWPNPWQSHSVWDEFDQLFNHLQNRSIESRFHHNSHFDFDESESHFLIGLDLPGVDPSDLNIEVDQGILAITGERRSSLRNRAIDGKFVRKFKLPEQVDERRIEAHFENGVLQLLLAKNEKEQPRKIEIKGEGGGFFEKLKSFRLDSKKSNKDSSQAS